MDPEEPGQEEISVKYVMENGSGFGNVWIRVEKI